MTATEDLIEDKIENQYLKCRRDYYKHMFRLLVGSMATIFIIISGIVAWSYEPIKAIAVLKREVVIMNEKLDVILKLNGHDKKKISEESENKPDKDKEIKIDALNIQSPALGAICKKRW